MKNTLKTIAFTLLVLTSCYSFSQETIECVSIIPEEHMAAYDNHQNSMKNLYVDFDFDSTITMKLQVHVIRRSNGTGGLSENNVELSLQQAIETYEQLNVTFDYCNTNYIDNDDYFEETQYSLSTSSQEFEMALANNVPDAINIYYVPDAMYGTSPVCGWSSFPSYETQYGKNWTVMDNNCATNGSTLAHELGHYFNLLHTHETARGSENVARSGNCTNCTTTGDELCDTPADPRLSSSSNVNSSCNYYGSYTDSCGENYNPDETNVMSYSRKLCRINFSPGQIDRMLLSIATDRKNVTNYCDGCKPELYITTNIESGQVDNQQASLKLEANNNIESNAIAYYKAGQEVVLSVGFHAKTGAKFKALIEDCNTTSAKNVERKINVVSIENNFDFNSHESIGLQAYPNPTQGIINLTINNFNEGLDSKYQIRIYDALGRTIFENSYNLNQLQLDLEYFDSGCYFLEVNSTTFKTIKRIIKR